MNIIKAIQGTGYLCAFVLSLVICVPMSMNQDQFKGRCLLFSTGEWQQTDGQFLVQWASQAYCNFTIFVAVIMFVVSVIQFSRFLKFLRKGREPSFFLAFIDCVICIMMCIFVLTAACFVSVGFNVWCIGMTRRFPTCSGATGSSIDKAEGIDSNGFYFQISLAQFGIWLSFSIWVMLLTFCTVKLCRLHHEENLRVSMAKERKRLLNEDLVSEVPVHATYPNSGGDSRRRSRGISSSRSHRGGAIGINNKGGEDNNAEQRFEEVMANNDLNPNNVDRGLVNDVVTEDFQSSAENSGAAGAGSGTSPQQSHHQRLPSQSHVSGADMNVSLEDGSCSSMTSSQHSYNSLPKGNQIHIDHTPDLLK